jgi:putative transposase
MQQISFAPGRRILVTGKAYSVTGITDNSAVHLLSDDNIERKVELETLFDWYQSGNLKPAKEGMADRARGAREIAKKIPRNEFHSERAKEKGLVVKAFLQTIEEQGLHIDDKNVLFRQAVDQLAIKLGVKAPSARTIYRWLSRAQFNSDGFERYIPRWSSRGGRGKSRQHPEVLQLMEEVMTNDYMNTSKRTMGACHELLAAKINALNLMRPKSAQLNVPARNTFERWIKTNSHAYEVYATRNSKRAADQKFITSMKNIEAWGFMQCVEVDHTPLDVMVTDEDQQTVLGRPRLTLMIEWKTRCCIGFTIGFEGTSTQTVLECVKVAVNHKGGFKKKYPSVKNEWECWGMPLYLKLDNGSEFHSTTFRISMAELGINLIYCPRKEAWFKGRVERAIKKINHELIATLPGATFTQHYNRLTGNDPSKYAVIDLKNLEEIIYTWIVDKYHQTYQKQIKSTPHDAWKRHFDLSVVALPGDTDQLNIICTELETRKLQHYGIEILEERTFNNADLGGLRLRKQFDKTMDVKVRYNPQKFDRVWVYDEDKAHWIEVENSNLETRNLTHFQMSMVNKIRNEEYKKSKQRISILEAMEQIKEIVRPLLKSKKQRDLKKAHKILGFTSHGEISKQDVLGEYQQKFVPHKSKHVKPRKINVEQQNQITTSKDKTRIKPESVTQIAIDAIYVGEIEVFPSESLHLRGGRNDW